MSRCATISSDGTVRICGTSTGIGYFLTVRAVSVLRTLFQINGLTVGCIVSLTTDCTHFSVIKATCAGIVGIVRTRNACRFIDASVIIGSRDITECKSFGAARIFTKTETTISRCYVRTIRSASFPVNVAR